MLNLRSLGSLAVRDIATAGLGIPPASLPSTDEDLRAALIAETIRVGLHHLYTENGARPVHQLALRNWVSRKLDGLSTDLFSEHVRMDYRDVLLEGGAGNLEFTGDVLALRNGYLAPAPPRAIETSARTFSLASGMPTALLGKLKDRVSLTLLGRRLVEVSRAELEENGIRVKTAEAFLGVAQHATPPQDLLRAILARPTERWQPATGVEAYQGELRDRMDFQWGPKQKAFSPSKGDSLVLWRMRVGFDYFEHWLVSLADPSNAHRVNGPEWKRACLALDWLSGSARKAFIHTAPKTSTLKLNFIPWAMFWRWMQLNGARNARRERGYRTWAIPTDSVPQAITLLSRVGIDVKQFHGESATL